MTAEQVERGEGPGGSRRVQARLRLGHGPDAPATEVLLYMPGSSRGERSERLPTFLHLNFGGNHAETAGPAVWIPQGWVSKGKVTGVTDNRARAESRGSLAHRWPIDTFPAVDVPAGHTIGYRNRTRPIRPCDSSTREPVEFKGFTNLAGTESEPIDLGFVNRAAGNLALRSQSRLADELPVFVRIPFDTIGLYQDEDRRQLPARYAGGNTPESDN